MENTQSTTIEAIIEAHMTIFKAIGASFGPVWMELDLSMAQLKALVTLANSGQLPIGQIAEMLGIGQPTASHLIDRLVQNDYVVRTEDPLDRRRTLAQLSPQGLELVNRLRQTRTEPLLRWLSQLDDATLAALNHGLQKLADVAAAETLSPPTST